MDVEEYRMVGQGCVLHDSVVAGEPAAMNCSAHGPVLIDEAASRAVTDEMQDMARMRIPEPHDLVHGDHCPMVSLKTSSTGADTLIVGVTDLVRDIEAVTEVELVDVLLLDGVREAETVTRTEVDCVFVSL